MSDTYILRREGWNFHAEEHEDVYHRAWRVRLAATSPDNGMVITGHAMIRREEMMDRYSPIMERWQHHGFDMQQYNSKDVFRYTSMEEINSWKALSPVDITAATMATEEQIVLRQFKVFSPVQEAAKEIFIPEKNVDDLLNEILRMQYPEQQEIKKGLILPAAKPILQAKILTLAA